MSATEISAALGRSKKTMDVFLAAERARLEALPAALVAALDRFSIHSSTDRDRKPVPPFLVVDGRTAEPDVNWLGDLVSEHPTHAEARTGLMKAALEDVGVLTR